MAVQEDNHVSKNYYSIYGGKVVRQWFQDEAPEGFSNLQKRITPESKKTVWYKNYTFGGTVTDMYEKKNDNLEGSPFEFYLELDNSDVLVMRSNSGYHTSFLLAMQNFPEGEELTFLPYNFVDKEKDKRIIGMVIKDSEGNKILPFYTKDDPKGLPQPTKNKKGVWNWDAYEDFLSDVFEAWKPKFLKAGKAVADVNDVDVVGHEEVPTKDGADMPNMETGETTKKVADDAEDDDVPF